ncbi:MAG: hypothetical protein ACREFB_18430 [Stellaceae bacterium]
MRELVLVIIDRPGSVPACLNAARHVAKSLMDPRIEVLHIRVDPISNLLPSEEVLTHEREAQRVHEESKRDAAVHQACLSWLSGSGIDAQSRFVWTDVESTIEEEVRQRGAEADFIIVSRPAKTRDLRGSRILRTAVLATDRPILIVPCEGTATVWHSVAILWTGDRATLKAVLNAMPLLAVASHVHVIAVCRESGGAILPLPRVLEGHDIRAEVRVIRPPSYRLGPSVLDVAHEIGADLLVMGAYTRYPIPEALAGGITRFMLAHTDLPLFVRH